MTTIDDLGILALGSRFKRLGEGLQGQTTAVLKAAGIAVPAAQLPILESIARAGEIGVGDIAADLGVSQPGITRALSALVADGLVAVDRSSTDARARLISLTPDGRELLERAARTVYPNLRTALAALVDGLPTAPLDQLSELERRLEHQSLSNRVKEAAL